MKKCVSLRQWSGLLARHGPTFCWRQVLQLKSPLLRKSLAFGLFFGLSLTDLIATEVYFFGPQESLPPSEYQALVSFYGAANGPAWTNKAGWLKPKSDWEGVMFEGTEITGDPPVVSKYGYVTVLNRDGINASGNLAGSIGNLTRLKQLFLGDNRLTGSIPSSLGSCLELQELGLGNNRLTGTIPSSLGNMASLTILGLHQNQLSGAIPTELGNLVNLRELWLPDNQLTGSLPSSLAGLQQLQIFSMSQNMLSGTVPAFLSSLAELTRLELSDNLFTGSIPSELGSLMQLQLLYMDGNQLSGEIPASLSNLAALEELCFSQNQLSGTIPPSLGNLSNLIGLVLEENELSGSVPEELGNLQNLEELALEKNRLAGRVPQAVLDLPQLSYFTIHDNYITLDTEQRAAFAASGWSTGTYEPQKIPQVQMTHVSGGMTGTPLSWNPITDKPVNAVFLVENLEPAVRGLIVTVESQNPWLRVSAGDAVAPATVASVSLGEQGSVSDSGTFKFHLELGAFTLGKTYTGSLKVYAGGKVTTVPVTLKYVDVTPPEVTPPAPSIAEATGPYGAFVTYPAATATDNVAVTSITYSHPSGSLFPTGVTTVTVTAKDAAKNEGKATFNITVRDSASPVISPLKHVIAEATGPGGAVVTYPLATATDAAGATSLTHSKASGTLFQLGTTVVTVTARDASGNTSSGSFSVTTRDTIAPLITRPSNIIAEATSAGGATVSYPPATATDAVGVTSLTYSIASGSLFPIGNTVVTITARDAANNTRQAAITITVRDTVAPIIATPANVFAETTDPSGAIVTYPPATATDAVGVTSLTHSPASGSFFPMGSTVVTIRAQDAANNTRFAAFTVTVRDPEGAAAAPMIFMVVQPQSQLVPLGSAASFHPLVIGDDPMTYQWKKGSANILNANTSSYTLLATKNVDASAYVLVADNPTSAPVFSQPAYLGLVTPVTGSLVLKKGAALSLKCTVIAPTSPGVMVRYVWNRGNDALTNGTLPSGAIVSGANKATLTITKVGMDEAGDYSCFVTLDTPGNDPQLANGTTVVNVVDDFPVMDPLLLPATVFVGQLIDVTVSATNLPFGFAATGLPAGWKLDTKTGRITGQATTAAKKDKSGNLIPNKITFKATNSRGIGPGLDFFLNILPLPSGFAGSYTGLVARDSRTGGTGDLGGLVTCAMTATGATTGKLTLWGKALPFKSTLRTSVDGSEGIIMATVFYPKPTAQAAALQVDLILTLNPDLRSMSGELICIQGSGSFSTLISGWQHQTAPLVTGTGLYNSALDTAAPAFEITPEGTRPYPQGTGYLTLTITPAGAVTFGGKLADGTTITGSRHLSPQGKVPLHLLFYANTGSLQGWAQITGNEVDGTLDWLKTPQPINSTTRSYKRGFPLHELIIIGGKYTKPANGLRVMDLPQNLEATFSEGGLVDALMQEFTLTTANAFQVPANNHSLKLTLNVASGQFTGSINQPGLQSTTPRKADIFGALIPGTAGGVGFFNLAENPDAAGETIGNTPLQSGTVEIKMP